LAISTCIFDAYGTLFDVSAAARRVAESGDFPQFEENWIELANFWRQKQLQYTWLRAITDAHCDFWRVTQDGLDWALAAIGLSADTALRQQLLDLYWALDAYGEVPEMLECLKREGLNVAILSNGSPKMLDAAVQSAKIGAYLDDVLSVESVGIFKPSSRVYDLVGERFQCEKTEVLFVSSNGWDAAGAAGYGFETVWVNRANEPQDILPWRPNHMLTNLVDIPNIAKGKK